jgi:probable rRNA maturation factor
MGTRKNRPRIEVIDRQDVRPVDASGVEALALHVLAGDASPRGVNLVFTDDAAIHDLNRRFLGHDWPTDVITFPLGDDDDLDGVEAEIVVSVETAVREASDRGVDPDLEIALYCVHGLLHLLGHDDTRPESAAKMHRETLRLLAETGHDVSSLDDLTEGDHG